MNELLTLLEKDGRQTPQQLATMLGREEKDVVEEIAEHEKNHVILGYPALIDWTKTDDELVTALIEVHVSRSAATALTASPSASTSTRRSRAST